MAEILSLIALFSFLIAGISFVLAVFFWFQFKIPAVIGDLSGRTARKSIALMRENNEKSGKKIYRPASVNIERQPIANTIQTGLLEENKARDYGETQTALLVEVEETALLVDMPRVKKKFKMLETVRLLHTDEVIESN